MITADIACGFSARYQSVIGRGRMSISPDSEKEKAMRLIMQHTAGREDMEFDAVTLAAVTVCRLDVAEMSCKEHL